MEAFSTPVADRVAPVTRAAAARTRLLRQTKGARTPIAILVAVVLVALLAPLLAPYEPTELDPTNPLAGPSGSHLFGTDELGRDLLSRMIYGARLSLMIALASTAVAMVAGLVWGATAALAPRRWIDDSSMLAADALLGIPVLLSALVLIAAFGTNVYALILVLGVINAPATARVVRAGVMGEKNTQYCQAAVALGASQWRIFASEILPNIRPILVVQAVIVAATVILIEAGLSFLGLGVQPPQASWGTLLFQGYNQLYSSVWFIVFPGVAIVLVIWALNALGDHLERVLDPRVRDALRLES